MKDMYLKELLKHARECDIEGPYGDEEEEDEDFGPPYEAS